MSAGLWWLIATGTSLAVGVPQAWRLLATGSSAGLHYAQDLIRVAGKVAWVVYAVAVGDLLFGAGQVGIVLPSVLTLILLWRWKVLPSGVAAAVPLAAGAASGLLVWAGAVGLLGHLVATSDVFRYLPQARRTLTADSLHGVSAGTYVAQASASVGWLGYGWEQGLWPLIWSNAVILPFVLFILIRVVADRRGAGATTEPAGR